MNELGLYRVTVARCGQPHNVQMAAENFDQAGKKAIRYFSNQYEDPYAENYRVTAVELIGSVVI